MNPGTERRIWLGLGAVIFALVGAVAVQSVLVQQSVVREVTEASGVVAGVALALPLALELFHPSGDAPAAARYRGAAAAIGGAVVAGTVAAQVVLVTSLASPVPAAVGAAAAYAGGQAARSFVLGRSETPPEPADGVESDAEL